MCESYILECQCGEKKGEIFFGKMLLDERSVKQLFCPNCSMRNDDNQQHRDHAEEASEDKFDHVAPSKYKCLNEIYPSRLLCHPWTSAALR